VTTKCVIVDKYGNSMIYELEDMEINKFYDVLDLIKKGEVPNFYQLENEMNNRGIKFKSFNGSFIKLNGIIY